MSACEDKADYDDAFKTAADACENCLDTGSCAEQADKCAGSDTCGQVFDKLGIDYTAAG